MIVEMKKASVIIQSKDAVSAVEKLRSMGLLHVEHRRPPEGKDVGAVKDDIDLIAGAIRILSAEELSKEVSEASEKPDEWKAVARHIIESWKRLGRLAEYSAGLKSEINLWENWGDFDPALVTALAEKNIHIRLYRVPKRDMKKFPAGVIVKRLFTAGGVVSCAAISREKIDIPFSEVALPKEGLDSLRARLAEGDRVMESIKDDIRGHVRYRKSLAAAETSLKKELEFKKALEGMGQAGSLVYVTGYIPHDAAGKLLEASKKEKWGVAISDPSEEDNVPTLIRNPRWVSIISPIFKAIEIIPGYRELDISLWFLVFFSVFFGMLIGDAGYGLIFFVLTLFSHLKWGKAPASRPLFILFYLLSSCAVIWGVFTGTFFGQEWLPRSVQPLIPALRESKNIQAFCFLLGAVHLSVAHLWRAVLKLPRPSALADVGWTFVLWGAFFLAKTLILGDGFPAFGKWLFISGALSVVFFTNPNKNILKGVGSGVGSLLLNFVNSFTDVVSYIRLFAVGLATVAIADAFNNMAMGIGYNSILTGAATSVILILGHALNVILGPLAILVHGVRLNVLEFCNHADIKWSGFAYKPLK